MIPSDRLEGLTLIVIETLSRHTPFSALMLENKGTIFPGARADANCFKCLSDIELILSFPGLNPLTALHIRSNKVIA
jgi:hypothetical protein